jgi:hypothetical protein
VGLSRHYFFRVVVVASGLLLGLGRLAVGAPGFYWDIRTDSAGVETGRILQVSNLDPANVPVGGEVWLFNASANSWIYEESGGEITCFWDGTGSTGRHALQGTGVGFYEFVEPSILERREAAAAAAGESEAEVAAAYGVLLLVGMKLWEVHREGLQRRSYLS